MSSINSKQDTYYHGLDSLASLFYPEEESAIENALDIPTAPETKSLKNCTITVGLVLGFGGIEGFLNAKNIDSSVVSLGVGYSTLYGKRSKLSMHIDSNS